MKKVILIDGNNLLFRSYYATAYKGSILRNSKGFPTNALYGFINMLNKIIYEDKPSYMMIAFDKGKTFRHEKYDGYKDGRKQTPDDLKIQFPVAKEIAKAMGIPCFEIDGYEADDIIGTFAKEVDLNDDFISTIVSSDKDLLQLISDDVEVKLLKSSDYIRINKTKFIEMYGFTPDKIVDLKGIMGDASDNIPGVKGIGEKGAISLLQKYGTIENIYKNIDEIKGKTKEKLINDKNNAFFSKELATICKSVPIDTDLNKIKYVGLTSDFVPILQEYEFFSLIKKMNISNDSVKINYDIVENFCINKDSSIYVETSSNYHDNQVLGITISNEDGNYFLESKNIKNITFMPGVTLYTYDLKKLYIVFKYNEIEIKNKIFDLMIESYILNYNIKDDISFLMNICGYNSFSCEELLKKKECSKNDFICNMIEKSNFIFKNRTEFYNKLKKEDCLYLYEKIDLPLAYVLADMEFTGVNIDSDYLNLMKKEVLNKLKELETDIYFLAGTDKFNIQSPKQLGNVLFEILGIPYPKKIKQDKSYSTSAEILEKLTDYDIVNKIIEYRMLSKLYSNYIVGMLDFIKDDGKIHAMFNQTLTRTGRLSSSNPNLQNIPIREEYGKLIRKAFIPSNGVIISSDYSQIELRVFAHMANASNLIEAFNNNMDIHQKTAMDIYKVSKEDVTSQMRRNAKAVNFGILYGISSFGLSADLGVNLKDAKSFIDNYLNTYPAIEEYMNCIKSDAKEKGYVKTLFGRKRIIDELKSNNFMVRSQGERIALNTPIQGTASDILKIAMIDIFDEFQRLNLNSKIIIQVHDELLIDCFSSEIEIVLKIIKEKMENAYKLKVPLKVDIEYGANWYEAK